MIRRLRRDLVWQEDRERGESLLCDPVSGRRFALSTAQVVILRALEAAPDREVAAAAVAQSLDLDLDLDVDLEFCAELIDALLDMLDALALLGDPPLERILVDQREARRAFFADSRVAALDDLLARLITLPYYAELLPELLPEGRPRIEHEADLARLPVLTKASLRTRLDDLLPAELPDDLRWLSTSGTTGERTQVARSGADWDATQRTTWAMNAALHPGLDGRFCRLTSPHCNGLACHLALGSMADRTQGRRLILPSSLDIAASSDARIVQTIAEMTQHAPRYLLVAPTYLAIVVDRALALGLALPRVDFVLTLYESSSALHRRAIAEAFECPVYDVYGATEYGAIIVQCERGTHHVNPESVIVEVDSPDSKGVGRMLVTTLHKTILPLLRYDTGDLAIAGTEPCTCAWSETPTLRSLEGREADAIRDVEGRRVSAGEVDRAIADLLPGVVSYCVVQRGPDRYRVELLPGRGFARAACEGAREALLALLGDGARIELAVERELLPAMSGKFSLTRPGWSYSEVFAEGPGSLGQVPNTASQTGVDTPK